MSERAARMGGGRFYLLLAVLLVLYLAWGALHLGGFQWDDDEGINVIKAQLVGAGFRLYRDIWSDQPPLLTWILAGTFHVAGQQVSAGRFVVLLFAITGLLGTALIARYASTSLAALLATGLLAVTPDVFMYSRAIMVGLPAMALAVLALAVAWNHPNKARLLAAGLLFAASLLIKPITAYQAIVLAAIVALPCYAARSVSWRLVLPRWGWLGLGGAALLVPLGLIVGPDLVTQVLGTYVATKTAYPFSLITNLSWLGGYLIRNAGLFVLVVWGLVAWFRTRRPELGSVALWLALALAALATHTPLRSHQLLLLLFPAAILAAAGLHWLEGALRCGCWPYRTLGAATVLAVCVWIAASLVTDASLLVATDNDSDNWASVEVVRGAVAPDELIVTDAPMMAFRAERRVPPSLAVPSLRRLRTGELAEEFVIAQTAVADPRAVVLWDGRFDLLPDYVKWVEQHYELARTFDGGRRRIYLSVRDIQHPQEVDFGGEIRLLGYRLQTTQVQPGDTLSVALYWQAIQQPKAMYTGFVHLLGPEGRVLSQRDLVAGTWSHVTAAWQPGEMVVEHYELQVPPDAPSGPWPLEVGLYDYYSGLRLPVVGTDSSPTGASSVLLDLRPVVRWPIQTASPQCQFSVDVNFGQVAQLVGYDILPLRVGPGSTVDLVLHWRALNQTSSQYTVFVHVLGPSGDLIVQADSQPCTGQCPTHGWLPDEFLADRHTFVLPSDTPSGAYHIAVGLYDLLNDQRLPATDGQGYPLPDNRVLLEGLEVLP